MTRTRASATLAFATAFIGASITSGMLATPIANAAPLDAVRAAVVNIRTGAACGALNYNIDLEGEAQALIGNSLSTSKPGNYKGDFITRRGQGDPQQEAIDDMIGRALGAIKNCSYTDFGVGFVRNNDTETDMVSVALGQVAAPPPEAKVDVPVVPQTTPCEGSAPVPVGTPCPVVAKVEEAPSPNSITMAVKKAGSGKVDVVFTNSSKVAGKCDYVATPTSFDPLNLLPTVNKTVDVKANGTGTISGLTDPRPLAGYHLEATCTGDFNGGSVPLGSPSTDI